MEMNFPHKGMQWPVLDEGRDVAAQRADQQALLARAIARQTSSQSARKFVAAKHDAGGAKQPLHASFMDDRMAFLPEGRVPARPATGKQYCSGPGVFGLIWHSRESTNERVVKL
ncbi:hypothetical protein C8024_07960 [Sphingopyxis sp. BSNA05]|uniref:hypothetical protein n=1 Tax=Sphingopyxis sp. BSNA05 TaxID=1236614 RepID=UPI0015649828|nr:hypothetical protein [Sphingopyxis sp. BSNA05]NRD89396.1 hypothetical protein [Sphingopyxis sp. BSNA05]